MDCHVFVVPGAMQRLLAYLTRAAETRDLLQGPLLYDDLNAIATHFPTGVAQRHVWLLGHGRAWPQSPMPRPSISPCKVWACSVAGAPSGRASTPVFRGFGGEDGYIHEKFRQNGGRTLCLPFLRWMHRFRRPWGCPIPIAGTIGVRNYMLGFRELGLATTELEQHYRDFMGEATGPMLERIKQELGT
jgi:hypothetical protein